MKKNLSYKSTVAACYAGYITQAAVNNLAPILFIVFQTKYGLSYDLISILILTNFAVQLITDGASVKLCKIFSTRTLAVTAHILCACGLAAMGAVPLITENAFAGLLISVVIYAIGGGLTEVLISPIIESIPDTKGSAKAAAMSLLHSFYCWGQVAVVLLSTLFISSFGYDMWYILPLLWAILPALNAILFSFVPIALTKEEAHGVPLKKLLQMKGFVFILLLMLCAGACELTMSQWSSLFAQNGLQVSKTIGDLLGPCLFALLMGIGRIICSVLTKKISIPYILIASGILCLGCYIVTAVSDNAAVSLISCALCGLSVAAMWPATFSLAAAGYREGGTGMFGLMALMGDLGCGGGPFIAGIICNAVTDSGANEAAGMKTGFAFSTAFPVILIISAAAVAFIAEKRKK